MPRKLTPEELEAREARLPAWARQELALLRRDRDFYRDERNALASNAYGPEDSNTKAAPYTETPINLPNGASVEFRLGDDHWNVIRVRVRDGVLDVNANGGLLVLPKATNHVDLKVSGH
ncbi:hypothetical protein SEA_BERRIE_63 [Arthrobacter phage Berrie]|uniref:Uncharacterized protein n=1 Tax=Arthrobacter phage Berrie TaxID=2926087 RepID=A0ABZ2CQG3_9CAUD